MAWKIEFTPAAGKAFDKLDSTIQSRIRRYMKERVLDEPKRLAEPLTGDKAGLWRYRVGDYRIITQHHDTTITIMVIRVGHRKDIYDF